MKLNGKNEDTSKKIEAALNKAIKKVIADEKARNGYLVVGDKNGKVKFKNSEKASDPNPNNYVYVKPLDISLGILLGYEFNN